MGIPFWFKLAGVASLVLGVICGLIPAFRRLEEHRFNGTSAQHDVSV
jgi:hypothetical protein